MAYQFDFIWMVVASKYGCFALYYASYSTYEAILGLLGVITGLLYFASIIGGLIGILLGNVKNIEYGEIGSPFDYLVIVSWVLFGINIIGTIVKRKVKYLYVSVWYALGA